MRDFDDHRGLGAVLGTDGRTYPFHCTALADGTRTVRPGTPVVFGVAPGPLGRWEATAIRQMAG